MERMTTLHTGLYRTPHLSAGFATGKLSAMPTMHPNYLLAGTGHEGLTIHPDGSFAFDLSVFLTSKKPKVKLISYPASGKFLLHGGSAYGQLGQEGQNDAPVATAYTASVTEDGDPTPDNRALWIMIRDLVLPLPKLPDGRLNIQANGSFIFDPLMPIGRKLPKDKLAL